MYRQNKRFVRSRNERRKSAKLKPRMEALERRYLLSGVPYQEFLLQTGTPLLETANDFDFIMFDVDDGGKPDLIAIKKIGTGSGFTELHGWSGESDFQLKILETPTGLPETNDHWEFFVGGIHDLVAINKQPGSGYTEMSVLTFSSGYQDFYLQNHQTGMGETGANYQFEFADWDSDGHDDLIAFKKYSTGTNSTEVHVLSGASLWQTPILATGTALQETDDSWDFEVGSIMDIVAIKKSGTATGSTEVHALDHATGYQTFVPGRQTGTPIEETGANWEFEFANYNGDAHDDLVGIKTNSTGTNSTELHILSGDLTPTSDLEQLVIADGVDFPHDVSISGTLVIDTSGASSLSGDISVIDGGSITQEGTAIDFDDAIFTSSQNGSLVIDIPAGGVIVETIGSISQQGNSITGRDVAVFVVTSVIQAGAPSPGGTAAGMVFGLTENSTWTSPTIQLEGYVEFYLDSTSSVGSGSTVWVFDNCVLTGTGSINGPVFVGASSAGDEAVLRPGASPGRLSVGDLSMNSRSALEIEMSSGSSGSSVTIDEIAFQTVDYDMVDASYSGTTSGQVLPATTWLDEYSATMNNTTGTVVWESPTYGANSYSGSGQGDGTFTQVWLPGYGDRTDVFHYGFQYAGHANGAIDNGVFTDFESTRDSFQYTYKNPPFDSPAGEGTNYDILLNGTFRTITDAAGTVKGKVEGSFHYEDPLFGDSSGNWEGTIIPTNLPTNPEIVIRDADWVLSGAELAGVTFSYEVSGPMPNIGSDFESPITDVQLFWVDDTMSVIGNPILDTDQVPIYWNSQSATVTVTDLPDPPADPAYLMMWANHDNRVQSVWPPLVNPDSSKLLLPVPNDLQVAAGLNSQNAGTDYDQVVVNGSVSLDNAALRVSLGFNPSQGQRFIIIDNDGSDAVSGTFAGLPEGGELEIDGQRFHITYQGGTGNDVVLTRNRAPEGANATWSVSENTTLNSSVAKSDPDGDAVTVEVLSGPSHAALAGFSLGADGEFSYTPQLDWSGTDSFTYRVYDGELYSAPFTVTLHVVPVPSPPTVEQVLVGSSSWSNAFKTNVTSANDGFYPLDAGVDQLKSLPWSINQIRVRFSEDVSVHESDLYVSGTMNAEYGVIPTSLQYNNLTFEATWAIAPVSRDKIVVNISDSITSVGSGDALDGDITTGTGLPSGDGSAGGHLHFRVNVLAGDADRNGTNSLNDLQILATNWQQATTATNFFADFDGSNSMSLNDLQILATNWQQKIADILDPPMHNFSAPIVIARKIHLWDLGFDEIMNADDEVDDEFDRQKKRQRKLFPRDFRRS